MTTATPTAPKAHPARQQAIQSYLDKLQGWCNSPAGSKDPEQGAKIGIGSQQLLVDPWERALLRQFFRGDQAGHAALMAHGIALIVKSTLDVERLKKHESNVSVEIYALQAELMLDTAIGMALLHETDLAITAVVQDGKVETAKQLSTFRHKLARAVSEAKKRIADSERQQAEALAGSMTDRPFAVEDPADEPRAEAAAAALAADPAVQTMIEEAAAAVEMPPRRRRRRRRRSTSGETAAPAPQPVSVPGRSKTLVVAAGALVAIWFAAVQLPSMTRSDLHVINPSEIDNTVDLSVEARPPSLFVTLPADQWEAMDAVRQTELIDSISAAASREGYVGARLKTDAGKPVARWLRLRGSERVLDHEGTPGPVPMSSPGRSEAR